jgi:putative ABC transport system permease protein
MIESFFKIAFRHLRKQLSYSIINIGGLAIGIACSFVILLYAMQELSYEQKFDKHDRIYRIATHFMTMGDFANGPEQAAKVLPDEYPWVEEITTAKVMGELPLFNKEIESVGIGLKVRNNFFRIFNYPFISGSPEHALDNSGSIIITSKLSEKLFGGENPMGKIVEAGKEKNPYVVTGVVDISDLNSHINADFWTAETPAEEEPNSNWLSASSYIYLLSSHNVSFGEIQEAMDKLIEKNVYPRLGGDFSFDEWYERDDAFRLIVQPIDNIYLSGILNFDLSPGGNETAVYVLLAIAILILIIASVNFINLTTARADKRSKEIGIRKVIGGSKLSLMSQFMMESILISLLSVILALGVAELILMMFQSFTGTILFNSVFENPTNIFLALGIGALLGILSGFYPALYLAAFQPIHAIKKGTHPGKSNQSFRNILVVFQFTLSIALITSTLIIFGQLEFMKKKDLGFNRSDVLILDNAYVLGNSFEDLKNKLENLDGVINISAVIRLPGSDNSFSITSLSVPGSEESLRVNLFRGDHDFINTLEFELIEGRGFDENLSSDSVSIILNEAAVKSLNLKNPVGTILNDREVVIGVVKDFNFESLRNNIGPAAISLHPEQGQKMAVKIEPGKYQNVIEFINREWNGNLLNNPLNYFFLDDNFGKLMKKDEEMARVVSLFTVLAIFISCLGLFGLSSYLAVLKKKEIGIRKVMGASITNILFLLNWKFSRLVLLAIILAIPITAYLMNWWLKGFAYKIELSATYFLLASTLTILLAWGTVSYQSIMAAFSNPVNSLREE